MKEKTYQVLKSGKVMGIIGTLDYIVNAIRLLESNLDRSAIHSPYTIGLIKQIAELRTPNIQIPNIQIPNI